jgi:hypothetical protein
MEGRIKERRGDKMISTNAYENVLCAAWLKEREGGGLLYMYTLKKSLHSIC